MRKLKAIIFLLALCFGLMPFYAFSQTGEPLQMMQVAPPVPGAQNDNINVPEAFGGGKTTSSSPQNGNQNAAPVSQTKTATPVPQNNSATETPPKPALNPNYPALPPVPVPGDDIIAPKPDALVPPVPGSEEPEKIAAENIYDDQKKTINPIVSTPLTTPTEKSPPPAEPASVPVTSGVAESPAKEKESRNEEKTSGSTAPAPHKNSADFKTQILSPSVYKKQYDANNQHLPRAVYESDYDNLVFINVERGDVNALRALLDTGRNVNMRNNRGETPLIKSLLNGQNAVARLLIARGADINAIGPYGITPLHIAAYMDNEEMVKLLTSMEALPFAVSQYGTTPLDVAFDRGNPRIYRIIKQKSDEMKLAELTRQEMQVKRESKQHNVEAGIQRKEKSRQIRLKTETKNLPEEAETEEAPQETAPKPPSEEDDKGIKDKIKSFIGDLMGSQKNSPAEGPETKKTEEQQVIVPPAINENVPPPKEVVVEEPKKPEETKQLPEIRRDENNKLIIPKSLFDSKKGEENENSGEKETGSQTSEVIKPEELPAAPITPLPLLPGQ